MATVLAVTGEGLTAALLFGAGGGFLLWRHRRDLRAHYAAEGTLPRRRLSFDLVVGGAALVLAVLLLFGFERFL